MAQKIGEVLKAIKAPKRKPEDKRQLTVREAIIRKAHRQKYPEFKTNNPDFTVKMETGELPEDISIETGLVAQEGALALRSLFFICSGALRSKAKYNTARARYDAYRDQLSELAQKTGFRGAVIRKLGSISAYPSTEFADWNLDKVENAAGKLAETVVQPIGVRFEVPLLAELGMTHEELAAEVMAKLTTILGTSSIKETRQVVSATTYGDVIEPTLGQYVEEGRIELPDDAVKVKTTWKVDTNPLLPPA
jgi:hypothetical protein